MIDKSGDFFSGVSFIDAFSNADASAGLMMGSAATLVLTLAYYAVRRTLTVMRKTMDRA